jgi:hypothetical protein
MIGQKQVCRYPVLGVEGSLGTSSAVNPLEAVPGARAVGLVYAGRWVWGAALPEGAKTDGVVQRFVANAGTGKPLGISYRNIVGTLPADETALNAYQDGHPVPTMKADSIWVKTGTVATLDQKVFAVNADGTSKTGAAGATVEGAVETDWKVVALQSDGAIGDLILISKI